MASLNKVQIIGRLGKDPEVRTTQNGKSVASFGVAVDDGYGDNKATEWFNVVAWEKQAEFAGKYLGKGRLVYVEGRMKTREYDDKDGNKRKVTELVAFQIQGLDKPPEGAAKGNGAGNAAGQAPGGAAADDIPFAWASLAPLAGALLAAAHMLGGGVA